MNINRRDFAQLGGMAALAALTVRGGDAFAHASAPTPMPMPTAHDDLLKFVAPELRPAMRASLSRPKLIFSDTTLPEIRENARKAMAADQNFLPDVPVKTQMITVRPGIEDVLVYVINAKPGTKRPAIVHMHGGGYVGGTAKQQVRKFQPLAAALDCTFITVEYQVAPEARYTTSVEQNYAALKWLYKEADALGFDGTRSAVMGESAGGGHAALLAFAARDRREFSLVAQVLSYPMIDDRTGSSVKLPPQFGGVGWDVASNRYGWRSLLGAEPGGRKVPVAGVPARRTDLTGLPPTWIGVGGIDLFAIEDIDFASRLLQAGVPTELVVTPGAYHSFDNIVPESGLAKAFVASRLAALRRAFAAPQA